MKYLAHTFSTPAENLAADEALLAITEVQGVEYLRIWESATPFVVVGLGNHLSQEVNLAACDEESIPVLRRFSGGGTVVQGPGCLSYALSLRVAGGDDFASVTATNRTVMERNRAAIEKVIGQPVHVLGHTDLETGGRKFSGNAQRRGRHAFLFHGTFLYAADLDLIERVLLHPSREPDWRGRRTHQEFLANLAATREAINEAMREAWNAKEGITANELGLPLEELSERHNDPAWVQRLP
ncbi:lipoate--protein ligase family protein [bacterium]|nr:lipoate--protein ligase family protein [bacterium]